MSDKSFRIIAVDDNDDTLEIIRISLQDHYDVMTISNPSELFSEIELFEPDLMILDVMMPKVTGFQLVQMLQKYPATRDIPVILLSAKNNPGDIKHGYKLGASLYLTKPFDPERLLKNVRMQLDKYTTNTPKKLPINDVVAKLRLAPGFQKGIIKLSAEWETDHECREAELKRRFMKRGKAS